MLVEGETSSETYNFNYMRNFNKKGHNLEFEANYSTSKEPEQASYSELQNPINLYLNYKDNIKNNKKSTLLNLDYTNPISENSKLELGAEIRADETSNNRVTTQLDEDYSAFNYDRNIYSGYINYNQKFYKLSMNNSEICRYFQN